MSGPGDVSRDDGFDADGFEADVPDDLDEIGDDVIGRFRPPIFAKTDRRGVRTWVLNVGDDERLLVVRLCAELRALLTDESDEIPPLLQRLFPPAFLDDPDKEAEYQRLMREELVTSRLVQIDAVSEALGPDGPDRLDEGQVVAFMQSVNALRIVLGTMLDVGEDDDVEIDPDDESAGEQQLYGYLSWLLDWTVRSLSA